MRRETIRCLKETAAKCRLNVVRMLRASGHGHIGGTYSSIDMVTALYFYKMNVNPEKPDWEDRSQYGSPDPGAVIGPALLATSCSTLTAVIFCKIMQKISGR